MKTFNVGKLIFATALIKFGLISLEPDYPYQLSRQITTSFEQDSTRGKFDMAAYSFSCIGEYQQALVYNDRDYTPRWTLKGAVKAGDSLFMRESKPVNAKNYIIQRAKKEQIIIINEAHHNPLHRVFTASLLKDLYRSGFRYLGAETLNFRDSTLNQRKYPTLSSGYYTKEPQYGNLIREALQLGYQVFPYEAVTKEEFASGKSREIAQAHHIETLLKRNPNAKILIHCGYDHVVEVPMSNSWQKAMAGRVKEFTGIDPLTIDQQQWTELSQPTKEHPLYQLMSIKESSIFFNSKEEIYPGLILGRTDIQVAHPHTTYQYGRPTWLLKEGRWKPCFLTKAQCSLGFPCLVLAYRESERVDRTKPTEQAVPVDILELTSWEERKALILPPGKYRIVLQSLNGEQQELTLKHR